MTTVLGRHKCCVSPQTTSLPHFRPFRYPRPSLPPPLSPHFRPFPPVSSGTLSGTLSPVRSGTSGACLSSSLAMLMYVPLWHFKSKVLCIFSSAGSQCEPPSPEGVTTTIQCSAVAVLFFGCAEVGCDRAGVRLWGGVVLAGGVALGTTPAQHDVIF